MDPVSHRWSDGQFDPVHHSDNVAPAKFTDALGADVRQDQPLPDRFVLIGRTVLEVISSRGEERPDEVCESVPLASRWRLAVPAYQ
jgi:hypothetical protein